MRLGFLMLGLVALTGQAEAAVVTKQFEVNATSFANFFNQPAPFDALSVRFGVTYDDAVSGFLTAPTFFEASTDGQINSGPFSAAPSFGYFLPNAMVANSHLVVGGAINGTNVMLNGTNDFSFSFDPTATGDRPVMLSFTTATAATGFVATNAVARPLEALTAVPEPSVWLMMLIGFCSVGAAMRVAKRKRKRFVAFA
jgi:hypothetical protein